MMRWKCVLTAALTAALGAPLVAAAPPAGSCKKTSTFTETFAGGGNEGGWWHHFSVLRNDGGKNKEFLYSGDAITHFPQTHTDPMGRASRFTGDFAARRVVAIGIDLATIRTDAVRDYRGMSPTLVLVNDSGTPNVIDDDCIVFFQSGAGMPLPDPARVNWTTYSFEIPSESTTLPQPNFGDPCPGRYCEVCAPTGDSVRDTQVPCWGVSKGTACPTLHDFDLTWRNVIRDVDQVRVDWMSPEWAHLIGGWQSGVDNPSITVCE